MRRWGCAQGLNCQAPAGPHEAGAGWARRAVQGCCLGSAAALREPAETGQVTPNQEPNKHLCIAHRWCPCRRNQARHVNLVLHLSSAASTGLSAPTCQSPCCLSKLRWTAAPGRPSCKQVKRKHVEVQAASKRTLPGCGAFSKTKAPTACWWSKHSHAWKPKRDRAIRA